MQLDNFSLAGKTAIVTGSSKGIGKAIAIQYARAGAKVVVSSRKLDACERVVGEIRDAGGQAIAKACNISDRDQIEALVGACESEFGPADVLVCNAAVNPYYGPLSGISDSAFDKTMAVNIRSNLWLINRVAPAMAAKGNGSIVIISSISGLAGTDKLGAYAITKAADIQLARNIAMEWGKQGIRANCIAPGLIKTDFAKALWDNPETLKRALDGSPLGIIGNPEDIAAPALLLATDAGRFITGQTLIVDGGAMINGTAA